MRTGVKTLRPPFLTAFILPLAAGAVLAGAGELEPAALAGGDFTVSDESALAYSLPGPRLDTSQLEPFAGGRQAFHQRWVGLAVIGGQWGQGTTPDGEA